MNEKRIYVGVITRAAGIKGDIWLKSFTSPPEDIFHLMPLSDETNDKHFNFTLLYEKKGMLRCGEKTIMDRNEAEALIKTKLYADAKSLSDDSGHDYSGHDYSGHDYSGMAVKTNDGVMRGTVLKIENYGASDILVIIAEDKTEFMVPINDDFIANIDKKNQQITLHEIANSFFEREES